MLFLFRGKSPIVIRVQKLQNFVMGTLPAPVFENLRVYARGIIFAQVRGKLDRAANHIIVSHESANESDDHHWRRSGRRATRHRNSRSFLPQSKQAQAEEGK